MRYPILPSLMLLLLAGALYLMPDGAFYGWRLYLRGTFARLDKPSDPRPDATQATQSTERDLLDLLAQKDAQIADLRIRLRDLGVTRENVEKVRIVPARVVRLGPDAGLDIYTIDAGTVDGAAPGQAVVVGQSLVGVIVRSGQNASLVLSLSSPGCYISSRFGEPGGAPGRPRTLGAVQGVGAGVAKAIVFSPESAAQEGWLVMTSGLEKGVPEGLLLGRLAGRFVSGEESGTMEAELRPDVELASIDFVAVLARDEPVEGDK